MSQKHKLNPDRWVENHGEVLMGYTVLRVRNREVAQDLVQDTLLAALQARDQFEGRSSERTWLVGILKRKIVDYFRNRLRERPVTEISLDEAEDELMQKLFDEKGMWKGGKPQDWSDPRRKLDAKEFMALLHKCLAGLPPRLATVFILREMEFLGTSQVCQDLRITASNFWQLMHRARLRLRHCLERSGLSGRPKK